MQVVLNQWVLPTCLLILQRVGQAMCFLIGIAFCLVQVRPLLFEASAECNMAQL
jgi:hypothetical protein